MRKITFLANTLLTKAPGNPDLFNANEKIFIAKNASYFPDKIISMKDYVRITIKLHNVIDSNVWYCHKNNVEVSK